MSTFAQLQSARTTAGAAYVTALAALKSAFVTLAALDQTLENRNVAGFPQLGFPRDEGLLTDALRQLSHAQFAPTNLPGDWESAVAAAVATNLSNFTTG